MEGVWAVLKIDSCITPRLLTVAKMVGKSYCVADIGTDHAYVPLYLVLNNKADSALAMDINRGPLLRAEVNIKKFSLTEKIKTRLSDGLKELENNEVDTVIIAGMGGILINSIIDADKDRLTSVKNYIIQPMTAVEETRKYLFLNNFKIVDEKLAKEDNKIYTIISAVPGKMEIDKEIYFYVGKSLIENKDEILPEFLDGKIYEYEKAIKSMANTQNEETKEKSVKYKELLDEFKNLRKWCSEW